MLPPEVSRNACFPPFNGESWMDVAFQVVRQDILLLISSNECSQFSEFSHSESMSCRFLNVVSILTVPNTIPGWESIRW